MHLQIMLNETATAIEVAKMLFQRYPPFKNARKRDQVLKVDQVSPANAGLEQLYKEKSTCSGNADT